MEKSQHGKPQIHQNRKTERGSALYIIFIAIALFAALSFAVARMMSGGSSAEVTVTEQAKLTATEVINYGRLLRQTVQTVRISNGCADTDIDFTVTGSDGYEHTPDTDDACKLFNGKGGGLLAPAPTSEGKSWGFSANVEIENVGKTCGTNDCAELVAYVEIAKEPVCRQINTQLAMTAETIDAEDQLVKITAAGAVFQGLYSLATGFSTSGIAPEMAGQYAGCLTETNPDSGRMIFVQVLLAR